jgi:hypothetical protein
VETGSVVPTGWSGTLTGTYPGFANVAGFDFRPNAGSPMHNSGTSSPPAPPGFPFPSPLFPPAFEAPSRAALPGAPAPRRIASGAIDLGAFEWPGSLFVDGFENGSASRWSLVDP